MQVRQSRRDRPGLALASGTLALGMLFSGDLMAQQPVPGQTMPATAWTVKPEWVRAHEEFLAGDAMGGRGSATRLEEIAANMWLRSSWLMG